MSNPHAEFPDLAPHHSAMLTQQSGILPSLILARHYRTVTTKRDLLALGFARSQCQVPALLIPIYNPYGEIVLYQARPDAPRLREGKPIKYETPRGSVMAVDVPPTDANRQGLRNPNEVLWITEGVKKGDALVSAGACAIALLGVWNWRGTNELGGKTILPAFEDITLNGQRPVYIAYDSDVMEKPAVLGALTRLSAWLTSRGAKVLYVYLPHAADGSKQGVDDYLAHGHTLEDLKQLATSLLRALLPPDLTPRCPYAATPSGLVMHRLTKDGEITVPLANFSATICTDVVEDNGTERHRRVEIEARLGQRTSRFTIAASAFAGMGWVVEHLGTEAILMPGMTLKDHCRTAIQMLSNKTVHRTVYTHIGWRQLDASWCFLHGAGAIGASGLVDDVEVALHDGLQRYILPEPARREADVQEAVRTSLRLLDVAPDDISIPIYMSVWRAVLGAAPFSVYLVGPTGAGKSTLAALAQQHFGPDMDASRLPGSWTSTANALGELQFLAKDALLTIDDFCPTGSQADQQRLHRDADRVFRSQGNGTGRQRMRADGGLQTPKPPRGLILATGEDLPRGQSLQARMLVVEMLADSLDWSVLSQCQTAAAEGVYTMALSGFLHWLAPQYGAVQEAMQGELLSLRQQTQQAGHKRTADIAAHLLFGWDLFLTFAYKIAAISEEERLGYAQRGWRALATAAQAQAELQHSEDPVGRFFILLRAVLSSGQAHLADRESNHIPAVDADHYGWQNIAMRAPSAAVPSYVEPMPDSWRPQGARMGWLDEEYLYLTPDATYAAIVQMAREQGETFTVTQRTLWKRLDERGMLIRERGQRHYSSRVRIHGKRERVVCVSRQILEGGGVQSGPSGPSGPSDANPLNINGLENDQLGPLRNSQNPEWSHNGHLENTQNQIDTRLGTTGTTGTTNIHIPPKDFDARTHTSEISARCPKCFAQRINTTGSYKLCLACGHKWQVENGHAG